MSKYITYATINNLAIELANLYSLEELCILKVKTSMDWLAQSEGIIRSYLYSTHSAIERALQIKMEELHKEATSPKVEEEEEPVR